MNKDEMEEIEKYFNEKLNGGRIFNSKKSVKKKVGFVEDVIIIKSKEQRNIIDISDESEEQRNISNGNINQSSPEIKSK